MPSFFSDGNTPRREDPRWRILQKILGATIAGGGGAGTPQVFNGHGAPVGLQAGQDAALASFYYDLDAPYTGYQWTGAGWV